MRRIELVVDSRVRPSEALPTATVDALKKRFTHLNPAHAKAADSLERLPRAAPSRIRGILHAKLKAEPKYLATWREDEGGLSLPRGGLVLAREVLENHGFEVESVDERCEGDPSLRHAYEHRLELRDYQEAVVAAAEEWEQGLVRSPTGSGKTTAMIASAARVGLPTLFVVHTSGLLDQWVRRLRHELGISEREVGIVGGGKKRIRPVTVGLQQSCCLMVEELAPAFGYLVCDEVHLFAAKTFSRFVDRMPARFRVGVSDDEKRKDRKEFLLHDLFGEVIEAVDRADLVARKVIFDVEVRLFRTGFERDWWSALPEQERPHHWGRLLEDMGADERRNARIVDVAAAEVRAGERVLLWAERVEHCERLRADVAARDPRVGLFLGGKKQEKEFARTLLGILDGSVRAAVGTYRAVSTALDVPVMSRGIACTPIHNNPPFVNQVRGRICRRPDGKDSAILYYPWDEAIFGLGVVDKLARIAKEVRLLEGGEWVDARQWARAEKARRKAEG